LTSAPQIDAAYVAAYAEGVKALGGVVRDFRMIKGLE
jgi:hypothetical protein